MFELLLDVKTRIHRWTRNNRIIRDFPKQYDLVGNITSNMRQDLHKELERRGQRCRCIRCMEVRKQTKSIHRAKLVVREIESELSNNIKLDSIYKDHYKELEKYKHSKNYFLSFESCNCNIKINTSLMPQFRSEYMILDKCEHYVKNSIQYYYKYIYCKCYNIYTKLNNKLNNKSSNKLNNGEWTGCDHNNTLYGFLRLRIMEINPDSCYYEFKTKTAFVRELHVYGTIQKVGDHNKNTVQHYGFGKKLLNKAEQLAIENNCTKIAIISGVGVRKYYEKHGYKKTTDGKYMVKELDNWIEQYIVLCIIFFIIILNII